jgi:uncharacterized protein DUF4124
LALVLLLPCITYADLFRWVDPETGSVKFSNSPPPWYGDPLRERNAPAVEVVPFKQAAKPRSDPAQGSSAVALLEARRRELLGALQLPDLQRGGENLQRQLEGLQAVSTELDRLDPKGAPARYLELQEAISKLRQRLEAAAR